MSRSLNQRGGFPSLTLYVTDGVPSEVMNVATQQKVVCDEDPDYDGKYVACGIKSNGCEYDVFIAPSSRAPFWKVEIQRQSDYSSYKPTDKTLTIIRRFKIKPKAPPSDPR